MTQSNDERSGQALKVVVGPQRPKLRAVQLTLARLQQA
jgi:hypothetical protein